MNGVVKILIVTLGLGLPAKEALAQIKKPPVKPISDFKKYKNAYENMGAIGDRGKKIGTDRERGNIDFTIRSLQRAQGIVNDGFYWRYVLGDRTQGRSNLENALGGLAEVPSFIYRGTPRAASKENALGGLAEVPRGTSRDQARQIVGGLRARYARLGNSVKNINAFETRVAAKMDELFAVRRAALRASLASKSLDELYTDVMDRIRLIEQVGTKKEEHKVLVGQGESHSTLSGKGKSSVLGGILGSGSSQLNGHSEGKWQSFALIAETFDHTISFERPEYVSVRGNRPGALNPLEARRAVELTIELTDLIREVEKPNRLGPLGIMQKWKNHGQLTFSQWGQQGKSYSIRMTNSVHDLERLNEIGIPTSGLAKLLRKDIDLDPME